MNSRLSVYCLTWDVTWKQQEVSEARVKVFVATKKLKNETEANCKFDPRKLTQKLNNPYENELQMLFLYKKQRLSTCRSVVLPRPATLLATLRIDSRGIQWNHRILTFIQWEQKMPRHQIPGWESSQTDATRPDIFTVKCQSSIGRNHLL